MTNLLQQVGRNLSAGVLVGLAALASINTPAVAGPAITSFTTGSTFTGFSTDETVGWKFTVAPSGNIQVTSLGWWDSSPTSPLSSSHRVGIWDTSGTLLTSVTVQTNSTLLGSFRYEQTAAVVLTAGTQYVIGGRDLVTDGDFYTSGVGSLLTDPAIQFNGAMRSDVGSGFSFPTVSTSANGRFGPNFQFSAVNDVPEPSTLFSLLLALGLLAGLQTRQKRSLV